MTLSWACALIGNDLYVADSDALLSFPYSTGDMRIAVAGANAPDYALGPHIASLGLASSVGTTLPAMYGNGMFVGQHGSWNRRPHSGYKDESVVCLCRHSAVIDCAAEPFAPSPQRSCAVGETAVFVLM